MPHNMEVCIVIPRGSETREAAPVTPGVRPTPPSGCFVTCIDIEWRRFICGGCRRPSLLGSFARDTFTTCCCIRCAAGCLPPAPRQDLLSWAVGAGFCRRRGRGLTGGARCSSPSTAGPALARRASSASWRSGGQLSGMVKGRRGRRVRWWGAVLRLADTATRVPGRRGSLCVWRGAARRSLAARKSSRLRGTFAGGCNGGGGARKGLGLQWRRGGGGQRAERRMPGQAGRLPRLGRPGAGLVPLSRGPAESTRTRPLCRGPWAMSDGLRRRRFGNWLDSGDAALLRSWAPDLVPHPHPRRPTSPPPARPASRHHAAHPPTHTPIRAATHAPAPHRRVPPHARAPPRFVFQARHSAGPSAGPSAGLSVGLSARPSAGPSAGQSSSPSAGPSAGPSACMSAGTGPEAAPGGGGGAVRRGRTRSRARAETRAPPAGGHGGERGCGGLHVRKRLRR